MADYAKNTWVDRDVQFPRRFTKTLETSSSVTLTPDPGTVTETGTLVSEVLMNHIEQGIFDAQQAADNAQASATNAQTSADGARTDETSAFVVEVRTDDPATPTVGRIWLRSDL